jgi:hypothetical protein
LKDVVETQAHGTQRAATMRRRLRPLLAELVANAQAEGTLRADFTPEDLPLVFWGGDRVIELAGEISSEIWRRQLGFVLDGLRSDAAHPLPAPPLTEAQLRLVGASKTRRT